MSTANRSLDESEIQKLIAADERKKRQESKVFDWPGEDNTRSLAEAVRDRQQIVKFDTGSRFVIKYDDKNSVVFIRPENKDLFVPCGYFEYDMLKGVL